MKKEKTINLAARMMAEARWKGVPPAERTKIARRAAQAPRKGKRCFCGETSMIDAANRYFICCRRAGVITVNLQAKPPEEPESVVASKPEEPGPVVASE
jgi:hypothetical protein